VNELQEDSPKQHVQLLIGRHLLIKFSTEGWLEGKVREHDLSCQRACVPTWFVEDEVSVDQRGI